MSDEPAPEVKFATDLKAATRVSPAIAAFVDTLTEPGLGPVERLSRVARIAYRFGGLDDRRLAEVVRVWMLHDPAACHRFIMGEDRLRVEKKVRELETANRSKDAVVASLKRKVDQLEAELQTRSSQCNEEDEGGDGVMTQKVEPK